MKYNFSLIAPHPDDEFLGCRHFVKTYSEYITQVIFLTNGERSVLGFPDMFEYIKIRRQESENWIKKNMPNADIIYLNIPDGVGSSELIGLYGAKLFEDFNGTGMYDYLVNKIKKLVSNNVLVCPLQDNHPSHEIAFTIGDILENKTVFYAIQEIFKRTIDKSSGVHFLKSNIFGYNFFNYFYIMSDEELIQKRKEFQTHYYSQYEGFLATDLEIRNWENYLSEIPLKLCHEDDFHKIENE